MAKYVFDTSAWLTLIEDEAGADYCLPWPDVAPAKAAVFNPLTQHPLYPLFNFDTLID